MEDHITASPLTWPDGWGRIHTPEQSRFENRTISQAVTFVLHELFLMGIEDWNVIISTNLRLRQDGLPISSQREPEDKGAAVWWMDGDNQRVIALGKYNKISDNIYAIGKTIEAMRGIDRWGGGEILDRTFTGFTALPSPDHIIARNWRDILDYYGDDIQEANEIYKRMRNIVHPDKETGNADKFYELNKAWEQCQTELEK